MIQILKNTHKIIVISKNHEFFAKVIKKFMAKYHKFIGGAQLNIIGVLIMQIFVFGYVQLLPEFLSLSHCIPFSLNKTLFLLLMTVYTESSPCSPLFLSLILFSSLSKALCLSQHIPVCV